MAGGKMKMFYGNVSSAHAIEIDREFRRLEEVYPCRGDCVEVEVEVGIEDWSYGCDVLTARFSASDEEKARKLVRCALLRAYQRYLREYWGDKNLRPLPEECTG